MSCEDRPGINEPLLNHIHSQIESVERPRSEQYEIVLLCEDHVIGGRDTRCVYDCETHFALDAPAIGDNESLAAHGADAEGFQNRARNPGVRTPCVNKGTGELLNGTALREVLDSDSRTEDSHFFHCTPQRAVSLIIVLPLASSQCLAETL
ncbi:MAG TPA: hypothetical protein VK565_08935 [Gemmatimonadaceae bacterium]|nr:hypothetical protein [Gemmatimonadaceae bacterium]